MKPNFALTPAPKRGRYDRGANRRERQALQRERVVAALIELIDANRSLNVANLVEVAGIGRNTFYEYFDDIEHALRLITIRAERDLSARAEVPLQGARTRLERAQVLARAWTEHVFEAPALAQAALRTQPNPSEPTPMSALAQYAMKVLGDADDAPDTAVGRAESLRVLAIAALFDAVSRSHFMVHRLSADELQAAFSDLSQRLLR